MKSRTIISSALLVLTALIWGIAFVAQSVGMDYVGTFTFNGVRFAVGGLVLLPVIAFINAQKKRKAIAEGATPESFKTPEALKARRKARRTVFLGGICCGIALAIAANLQQYGIIYTTTGKAGFLTACYIIIVPILGLFLHKKTTSFLWIGVALAMVGMVFLCFIGKGNEVMEGVPSVNLLGLQISVGDITLFACAIMFSVQILIIDHFSPMVDGVQMSCIQFFTVSVLSSICMFLFEKPELHAILSAYLPILYTGVLSSGVAYTLQIVAQKDLNPTVASLIMSLESTFSLLAGWIILGQRMTVYEIVGCVLIFVAIVLAQLPGKEKG